MSTFQKLIRSFTDLSAPLLGYIVLVTISSAALAAALVLAGQDLGNPAGVIALAVVAAICERGRIVLGGDFGVSISLLPATYAAVLFGPLAGMVVFGASVVGLSMPLPGQDGVFRKSHADGSGGGWQRRCRRDGHALGRDWPGSRGVCGGSFGRRGFGRRSRVGRVLLARQGDFPSGLLRTHPGHRRFGSDLQPRRGCSCSCLPRSLAVDAALVLCPCAWPPRDGSCCTRSSGGLRQISAA